MKHQMGEFRYRAALLRLQAEEDGSLSWSTLRHTWMKAERKSGGNIFSSVGLSTESWEFTIRKQDITMADAIGWDGSHYFLTEICEEEPGFLLLKAARVKQASCRAGMEKGGEGYTFPAALTEKYIRHEEPRPMSVNVITYVLVTPKAVTLRSGSLVDVDGEAYEVLCGHILDEYKNEYEVCRKKDL